MSKLEQLINELCPDGVEFVSLGSLMTKVTNKQKYSPEITQVYVVSNTLGMVKAEEYRENTIHSDDISNYTVVKTGMFAYNPSRLNIGSIAMLKKEDGVVSPMYVVFEVDTSKITLEYFELLIKSSFVKNKIASYKEEGARFRFDFSRWDWIKVQLPPIEIQNTIVEHLNTFFKYLDNLIDEHSARKQQYEYYRDYLLSFDDEDIEKVIPDIDCSMVKMCPLSDVAEIYDGTHQTPNYTESGVPFISVENINSIYSSTKFISQEDFNKYKIKPKVNDVFMTRIGSIGACAVFDKQTDLAYYVSLALIRPNPELLNSKYLKYAIESKQGRKELRKRTLVNAVPIKINKNDIGKIILPIPSLETQNNIVKILDRFDMLCNGISEGIPAEIEARKQQYEYYRDTLLSFNQEQCSQIVNVERERES